MEASQPIARMYVTRFIWNEMKIFRIIEVYVVINGLEYRASLK